MRKDEAAASEVVGALMLILIVVGAAASFAVFVQQEQMEVQENRALQGRRDNERVEVVAATFDVSEQSHRLISNVSVVLQNQWTEDSVVDDVSVGLNFMRAGNLSYTRAGGSPALYNFSAENGCPVSPSILSQRNAHVVRQGSDLATATCVLTDTSDFVGWGSPDILLVDALDRIHLLRGERVQVSFNLSSAKEAHQIEPANGTFPVQVAFRTAFGNAVGRTFEPPVPLIRFTTDAATGVPLADARGSEMTDGYRTGVVWNFNLLRVNSTLVTGPGTFDGCPVIETDVAFERTQVLFDLDDAALLDSPGPCTDGRLRYSVRLEVTSSSGLVGVASTTFERVIGA